jgi:pyruvate ferredoxin oxidoreductase gamma subunit
MGAPIRAFARISDKVINVHSQVYYPDYVVVLDNTLITNPSIKEGLKETGKIIANFPDGKEKLKALLGGAYDVHAVNATKISTEEIGRPMANTAMVGALVRVSKIVDMKSVTTELAAKFAGKFSPAIIEKNIRSVVRAYEEVD